MTGLTIFALIIGLPVFLLCAGFFLLILRFFRNGGDRQAGLQTLEAAQKLERTLDRLESRLNALENIILSPRDQGRNRNDE